MAFVIVIGRQYGSGGRRLGRRLAQLLEVPYYDKNLLSEAAASLGFSKNIFDKADEKRPSFLRSLLPLNYGASSAAVATEPLSGENLYKIQCEVIRKLCENGSCVIVGRTADHVMRDHPGLTSIFIHAPLEKRAKDIVNRGDASTLREAAALARKHDKNREEYYNYYTNRNWGHADNYDITLDSSKFDLEDFARLLADKIKREYST